MAARRVLLLCMVAIAIAACFPADRSSHPGGGELLGAATSLGTAAQSQTVSPNLRRIGADRSPLSRIDGVDTPPSVDVAIIDSGVTLDHPDLNVVGGAVCAHGKLDPSQQPDDLTGHGTAVASVIGARDNNIGVVGVAPGARLWALRVANRGADGRVRYATADLVCALRWVVDHADTIEVVNLSLGSYTPFPIDDAHCGTAQPTSESALHGAICKAVAAGVTVVVAAGEPRPTMPRSDAAYVSPAAFDEVITVSAMADFDGRGGGRSRSHCARGERDDTLWDESNYGADVDLAAPGVCIEDVNGDRWSGTSFAAPHVAGAAALVRLTQPNATPAEVKQTLLLAAEHGWNIANDDPDGVVEPLLNVAAIGLQAQATPGRSRFVALRIEPGSGKRGVWW
jgi:subtilisin